MGKDYLAVKISILALSAFVKLRSASYNCLAVIISESESEYEASLC